MHNKTRSRRQFIQSSLSTLALSGVAIPFIASGCSSKRSSDKEIVLGTTGYAAEAFNKILHDLDFTGQTGLKVKVRIRPTTTNELLTQMISAVQAGTSPYDVLDLEDAAAPDRQGVEQLDVDGAPLDGRVQDRQRLIGAPEVVEPDAEDVAEAGRVGVELDGSAQGHESFVESLLTNQTQTQRGRIVGGTLYGQLLENQSFGLDVVIVDE